MNRAFDRAERNRDERRAARYIVRDQPTGSSASRPASRQRGKTSSRVGSIRKRTLIRGKTSALRTPRISGDGPVGGNRSLALARIAHVSAFLDGQGATPYSPLGSIRSAVSAIVQFCKERRGAATNASSDLPAGVLCGSAHSLGKGMTASSLWSAIAC